MTHFDLVAIGDIKLDTFVVLDSASVQCELKMPECMLCMDYGSKIAVDVVDSQMAGSAPNVAVGLARQEKRTAVVSVTGEDGTRDLAMKRLDEEGVATDFILKDADEQSSYSVVLNYKGEKTILTSHIKHNYRLPEQIDSPDWLYVCEMGGGYESLYREIMTYEADHDVKVAANPGSVQLEEKKEELINLIKQLDILFLNKEEAQDLTGEKSGEIHHLASALWKMGPKMAVITDGKNGSYSFNGEELVFCPIFPGEAIEATGAGDAFATGYIGAIIDGKEHDEALRWGAINASSVVQHVGPQPGLLSAKAIKKRLEENSDFQTKEM